MFGRIGAARAAVVCPGLSPGANISTGCAVLEATHGTATKYAGQGKANPSH